MELETNPSTTLRTGVLYYGDNLDVLRKHIPDGSIDLIYLDPPFNSNRSYNVLFRESTGAGSEAQLEAFEDTWHWGPPAQATYEEVQTGPHQNVARMLRAMVDGLGHNDVTAYLTMMAVRLVELRRVLKSTGSIYLHCDSTAGPYLRVIMDAIFGTVNFRNEIIWKRANAHNDPKRFGRISDTLLFYTKGKTYVWNTQHTPYRDEYYDSHFKRDTGERWYRTVPLDAPRHGEGSPALIYEWKGKSPAPTRTWAVRKEVMEEYERRGVLRYTRDLPPENCTT